MTKDTMTMKIKDPHYTEPHSKGRGRGVNDSKASPLEVDITADQTKKVVLKGGLLTKLYS